MKHTKLAATILGFVVLPASLLASWHSQHPMMGPYGQSQMMPTPNERSYMMEDPMMEMHRQRMEMMRNQWDMPMGRGPGSGMGMMGNPQDMPMGRGPRSGMGMMGNPQDMPMRQRPQ